MSDPPYVATFEDHAKRASVGLHDGVLSDLPFDPGTELGVSRAEDGVVVVADPTDEEGSAILRATDGGTRLYLDRTLAYDAGLLDADVVLVPRSGELSIEPA
ncbi:MAG: hypothetical protein ABEJ61_07660 [Haloferacaceae archaeon]